MNNIRERRPLIAVDFDGTIVEHRYPAIGAEMPFAFEVLRELQDEGYRLILWTFRDGETLKEAVEYCLNNGIMFYAVNHSEPNEEFNKYMSRKINADIFIDDRNVGGFLGWLKIRELLLPDSKSIPKSTITGTDSTKNKSEKNGLLKRIFG